jgi:hypothetical protein
MKAFNPRAYPRTAVVQTVLLVAAVVGTFSGNAVLMSLALLWAVPMIFTIELGKTRARAGWMWGFFLGWLGVLILACMSNRSRAHKVRELDLRELEVRELEAKVRLVELGQAAPEEKS